MLIQRVSGNVKTERFLLEGERLLRRPFGHGRVNVAGLLCAFAGCAQHPENIDLIARLVALVRLARFHGILQRTEHARA